MVRRLALTFIPLTLFSWNDLFPAKAPFPEASHLGEDNARRTKTKIKQGNTFNCHFLAGDSLG